ncbi:MAG: hypothetical protein WA759_14410, partial [Pseudolabrys sp.]
PLGRSCFRPSAFARSRQRPVWRWWPAFALAGVGVSAWNLAGAFTLVGCAAAILGEIEAIVEYTRMMPPRSRADD